MLAGVLALCTGVAVAAEPVAPGGNRLTDSNSPYLLLHADNPVDWYPWGEEALAKARREDKPIFVSVGYSTCYWCHVAEREIYSVPEIAALMNEWFVNIKVDREQRPDVDGVYMIATQILTGHGGWPNNVFLTPELKPFYAGSYFPPADDPARGPGFPSVLRAVHRSWTDRREEVDRIAGQVYATLQAVARRPVESAPVQDRDALFALARSVLIGRFDAANPGFGDPGGTKFPQAPVLELLLEDAGANQVASSRSMLTAQLDAMALGGIRDQLDGGFHRYSTEPTWSVPHFEKMLYDNAQLLRVYSEAFALTRRPLYRQVAEGIAGYLRRQMTDPKGGFYTALDAQIDGREGAHYLWQREEIERVLGTADADRFFALYELVPLPQPAAGPEAGSEAKSTGAVLRVRRERLEQARAADPKLSAELEALAPLRKRLLTVRDRRPQAARDEKLVIGLNALAIEGLLASGHRLDRGEDIALARRAAERLWRDAFEPRDGALAHQIFRGRAGTASFADDYALLGRALLALASATGEARWGERARKLADVLLARFIVDGELILSQGKDLPIQPLELGDNASPSAASATLALLFALGSAADGEPYRAAAASLLPTLIAPLARQPSGWGVMLASLSRYRVQPEAPQPIAALDSAAHVRASAQALVRADHDELIVRLDIEGGYHLNANPATLDYLVPTRLSLEGGIPMQVSYPKGQRFATEFARTALDVYEGEVTIRARLQPGTLESVDSARLSVQACTAKICLPPAKIDVPVGVDRDL